MLRRLIPPIPLFCRFSALILLLCTVVLITIVGLVRALNRDPVCVVIENGWRVTIDPFSNHNIEGHQFGREFSPPQVANSSGYAYRVIAISPDRGHYAAIRNEHPDQVEVGEYRLHPLFYKSSSDAAYIQWSPDGRRIAFVDDQQTLRITDSQGKVLNLMQAPADVSMVYLSGWSADSRYLAVSMTPSGAPFRLELLDAETLSPIMPNPSTVGADLLCTGAAIIACSPWAASGAHASYVDNGPMDLVSGATVGKLMMVNAGQVVQTFALPESPMRTFARSNDGRWVAVASLPINLNEPSPNYVEGRLDIYGEDGTTITEVDRVALASRGLYVGEILWSPDSRSLFYFRHDATDSSKMQLIRYDAQTHTSQTIRSVASGNFYILGVSSNETLLVMDIYAYKPNMRLIHINDEYLTSFGANVVQFSDDLWKGNLLVYKDWDATQPLENIYIMDENGTLLRRYSEPFSDSNALYWSNCQ